MAKKNQIYAVVGMNDVKTCNKSMDLKCPKDGAYIYNTATVFDSTGLVVARYHKKHIFSPFPVFDTPDKAQVRHFDTTFGVRFGIFICFDSLFPDPPLELVRLGVQHYVFPTDWSNIPPILTATQYQQVSLTCFAALAHAHCRQNNHITCPLESPTVLLCAPCQYFAVHL